MVKIIKLYVIVIVVAFVAITFVGCRKAPVRIADNNYSSEVEYAIRNEVRTKFGNFPNDKLLDVNNLFFLGLTDSKGLENIPALRELYIDKVSLETDFSFLKGYKFPLSKLIINGGELSGKDIENIFLNSPKHLELNNITIKSNAKIDMTKSIKTLILNNIKITNSNELAINNLEVLDEINIKNTNLNQLKIKFTSNNKTNKVILKENINLKNIKFLNNFINSNNFELDVTYIELDKIENFIKNTTAKEILLVVDDDNYNLDIFEKFREYLSAQLPNGDKNITFGYYN